MTDDREEMQTRRKHGLKARHETRVERAIRRQVAEEIAEACAARAKISQRAPESMTGVREGMFVTWLAAEKLAREFATKEATDA